MFRSKRLWWAVIVFLFSIYTPTKAHAVKIDPYQYKTIVGRVGFSYERASTSYADKPGQSNSSLAQNYTLESYGNIFNRLLIIYDAGIAYSKRISETAVSKTDRDYSSYYFKTTFIPRSIIPLTLRTRKFITEFSETTTHGLLWEGKFRRLPKTRVSADRKISDNNALTQKNTDYAVLMEKELGPSENEFRYSLSEMTGSTGMNNSISAMNFLNQTEISKNTNFYLGAARGEAIGFGSSKKTNEGVVVNLSSSPGEEFSQGHAYSYRRSSSRDDTNENNNYSGDMSYRFSRRLSSSMKLASTTTDSNSSTIKSHADSLSMQGSLIYSLGRGLSVSESIRYAKYRTSSSDAGQSNLSDRTILEVTTGIGYRKRLSWAQLGVGYSVGYREEKRTWDPKLGQGLDQSLRLALTGMDALGYAKVDATAEYSYIEPLYGNIREQATSFTLAARNNIWRKYLALNGSYIRVENKTWIEEDYSRNNKLILTGSVLHLKRVRINFGARRENSYNSYDNQSTTTSRRFAITHNRRLYDGNLSAQMLYRTASSDFNGIRERTTDIIYSVNYSRWLLRRIPWKASLNRNEQDTNGNLSIDTQLSNTISYRLRAWSLGVNHTYNLREYLNLWSLDSRIMLTAARSFMLRRL